MKNKPGFLIIVIQSFIIALLIVYLVVSLGDSSANESLEEEIAGMKDSVTAVMHRNDSLSLLLQEIRIMNALPPFLDKTQVDDLVKKGLENPVEDLRRDLESAPDLIGSPAVLGGKMDFYFHDGIHILNKRWVFAYFEDGHMAGAMLLKYDIDADGGIAWEVLDEIIY